MSDFTLMGKVDPVEWQLRVDLAAAYRLVALYGWSDLVFTHISARIPGPEHHFLINPYGMLYEEITASSLIRVDQDCNKLSPSPYEVNPAGFIIHSCIHNSRHDVGCVLHTHTRAGVAVSAQEGGLLPISQQSTFILPQLAYHDYQGVVLRTSEQEQLRNSLGDNKYLILRNHGLAVMGSTVADAFVSMYMFESACQIQISAQAGGLLRLVDARILETMPAVIAAATRGQGPALAWPALIRKLDRIDPGFRY